MVNVKAKLASDLGAATVTNISVNLTNGVVTLAGIVHNSEENVPRVNDNLQAVNAVAPHRGAPSLAESRDTHYLRCAVCF